MKCVDSRSNRMCCFPLWYIVRIFSKVGLALSDFSFSFHDMLHIDFRPNRMVLYCRDSLNQLARTCNVMSLGSHVNNLNHSSLYADIWTDRREMDFHIFRDSNFNWNSLFCFSNERDLRKNHIWIEETLCDLIKYVNFITFKWWERW